MRGIVCYALSAALIASCAVRGSAFEAPPDAEEVGGAAATGSVLAPFVPEDCFLALVVRPKRITQCLYFERLTQEVAEQAFVSLSRNLRFDPRKSESFTMILAPHVPLAKERDPAPFAEPTPPCDVGYIVRFVEPRPDREHLGKMFRDYEFAGGRVIHAEQPYYRGYREQRPVPIEIERSADYAVHFPDDRTIVFSSSEPMLKRMLSAREVKARLVDGLRRLDAEYDLALIATTEQEHLAQTAKAIESRASPAMNGLLRASKLGDAATLIVDLRLDPVARLQIEARDLEGATELKELLDDALAATRSWFPEQRDVIAASIGAPRPGAWVVEMIDQMLNGCTLDVHGKTVSGKLKRPEALAGLPELLTALVESERRAQDRLERRTSASNEVGMTVVYEIEANDYRPAAKPSDAEIRALLVALERRLSSAGRKSGRLRQLEGGRIEASIFRADPDVMQRIAEFLARPGTLEFRIVANQRDHAELIEQAGRSDATTLYDTEGRRLAWWAPAAIGKEDLAEARETAKRTVRRAGREVREVLVVDDEFDITQEHVKDAVADLDVRLERCVNVTLSEAGAQRMSALTEGNLPDGAFRRRVAVLLDGRLHSVPVIAGKVAEKLRISGPFTPEEAQDLIDVLKSGTLPLGIRKTE
ncbi:MAG: hypothetical protein RIC55_11230 [Pirellulaceae bacterium]